MTNIGFLGVGNMGKAIIDSIERADNIQIYAYDNDKEKLEKIENIHICEDEKELALMSDYLFLCIKPQIADKIIEKISINIRPDTIIVSIMAGISGEHIQKSINNCKYAGSLLGQLSDNFQNTVKVIQVMPNTPLMLGEGAVALTKFEPVSNDEFKFVTDIFSACGKAFSVCNDQMNDVIPINASSPAFIYLFANAFIEYGLSRGMEENTCKELFAQSLIGAGKMILDINMSVDELIKQVSSPGGTTIAGLESLNASKFSEIVKNACNACRNRAVQLGNGI